MAAASPNFVAVSQLTSGLAKERYVEGLTAYGTQSVDELTTEFLYETGGETVFPRSATWTNVGGGASQSLRLVGFRCRRTEVTSTCTLSSGSTAAAATPTLVRYGLWHRELDGSYTLVASTANDVTIAAATNTAYPKNWSTPYTKIEGDEYLVGYLVVSAVATPSWLGPFSPTFPAGLTPSIFKPIRAGAVGGLSDLPTTIAAATITTSSQTFHAILT